MLEEYMSDLRQFQEIDFATYSSTMMVRRAVERTLQITVEACLDIGKHIISANRFRFPVDNKDVFSVLAEEGIVPNSLLLPLGDMARFRNLIVHDYARIDDSIVYSILTRKLDVVEIYAQAIVDYLERSK